MGAHANRNLKEYLKPNFPLQLTAKQQRTERALPIRGGKREVGINIQRATCQISNGGSIPLFGVARLLFIRIKVNAADDAKADD